MEKIINSKLVFESLSDFLSEGVIYQGKTAKEYISNIIERLDPEEILRDANIQSPFNNNDFLEIIRNTNELDEIDKIVARNGYSNMEEFDAETAGGHFDDGFYNPEIYISKESFLNILLGYVNEIKEIEKEGNL